MSGAFLSLTDLRTKVGVPSIYGTVGDGCVICVLLPIAPSGIGVTSLVISLSPGSSRSIPASGAATASCMTITSQVATISCL